VLGDELDERMHGTDWRVYQRKSVEDTLANDDMHVWVAERDGAAVAFMAVTLHPDESVGQLWMIAVDPAAQGHGLGTRLTKLATEWMRDAGMRVALIGTGGDPGHAPARHVYEKSGFTALPSVQYFKAL
jgi:GNAT superfamily N-acetyltransferase